jgi:dienelactone hydrolase
MTSLDQMAQDSIAALDFLRSQPEIDPRRVGLWGHSQAGQVISRASTLSSDIAFVIVLAGGGATPREVEDYGYLGRLRRANASPDAIMRALAWVRDYYDYVRTGRGYDALVGRLSAEPAAEWVRALGVSTVYPTPEQQPSWQWVATYDPAADIRRMRMPVLLLFGSADESTPAGPSLAAWRAALAAGGNRRVEWRTFAGADHHFLVPPETSGWPSLAPRYYEVQIAWLNRLVRRT